MKHEMSRAERGLEEEKPTHNGTKRNGHVETDPVIQVKLSELRPITRRGPSKGGSHKRPTRIRFQHKRGCLQRLKERLEWMGGWGGGGVGWGGVGWVGSKVREPSRCAPAWQLQDEQSWGKKKKDPKPWRGNLRSSSTAKTWVHRRRRRSFVLRVLREDDASRGTTRL
jgi:hypothetical protein